MSTYRLAINDLWGSTNLSAVQANRHHSLHLAARNGVSMLLDMAGRLGLVHPLSSCVAGSKAILADVPKSVFAQLA
jgi:hypothetical protein